MVRRVWLLGLLALAGCAHVPPGDTAGLPPPWPRPDAPLVRKQEAPPPAEPTGPAPSPERLGVPKMKPSVAPPPATPNQPQSR